MESFFGTLKSELYYLQKWATVEQLNKTINDYTDNYTLSLHDALPICRSQEDRALGDDLRLRRRHRGRTRGDGDRKSTRLNSSHVERSYAVFCLKKTRKLFG